MIRETGFLSCHLIFLAIAFAGDVTITSDSPTVDGVDLYNEVVTTTKIKWFSDTPNQGQQFTTGSSISLLLGFSFQLGTTSQVPIPQKIYTIRVVTFSGTTTTTIALEAGHTQAASENWSSGNWINFTFDTPVPLEANTLYGVDGEMTTSGAWQSGIPYIFRPSDAYSGGQKYQRVDGDPTASTVDSKDFNFHINLALVPKGSLFMIE
jgi:hypothetical protein